MRYALYFCILVLVALILYSSSFIMNAVAKIHVSVCEIKNDVSNIQRDLGYYGRQATNEPHNP